MIVLFVYGGNEMPIIIFDALDTIQGYKGAGPGASKRFYQEHLARKMEFPLELFLKIFPYEAQCSILRYEITNGNLEPVALPGAKELLTSVISQGITPIIVTADFPKTADLTTKPLQGLVSPDNIYAVASLGSKKESSCWKTVRERYFPSEKILGVFEDTPENLSAAIAAYSTIGYLVDEKTVGIDRTLHDTVKGGLAALRLELEQRLKDDGLR